MSSKRGFSLIEVLISLCIFCFSTLALFKHQWHLTKLLQYQKKQLLAQQILDDASEILLANFKITPTLYHIVKQQLQGNLSFYNIKHQYNISVSFKAYDGKKLKLYKLERLL